MTIQTKNHNVIVANVISTNIRKNGKTYPAFKFIFDGAVSEEDLKALTSGKIAIDKNEQIGYNTLNEVSVTVGKITTAEEDLSELEAEHREYVETVETILPALDDKIAVSVKTLFPKWEANKKYLINDRLLYDDILYKVQQNHISQSNWTPDAVPSLYVALNETNAGTFEDPIPAVSGMNYEKDKYYVYNDVIYLCIREDTEEGTVLQYTPDQLVGTYFEVVE